MPSARRARRRHDRRQGASRSRRTARCCARGGGLPALDAAAGLVGAGSRGLVARGAAVLDELGGDVAAIGLSGQMHGLVALDAAEHVLRPAILWNDQRTGAECAEIEERVGLERLIDADRQPGAHGLHRAEAALAAPPRAGGLRADRARAAAEGLRPPAADGRARDRRGGRLGNAAASTSPQRRWSDEVLRGAGASHGMAAAGARVARGLRRDAAGVPSRPARATRRRARSASASTGPGRSRSCSARPASSSRRCPRIAADPEARCTSSATPCPARGTRWA